MVGLDINGGIKDNEVVHSLCRCESRRADSTRGLRRAVRASAGASSVLFRPYVHHAGYGGYAGGELGCAPKAHVRIQG